MRNLFDNKTVVLSKIDLSHAKVIAHKGKQEAVRGDWTNPKPLCVSVPPWQLDVTYC